MAISSNATGLRPGVVTSTTRPTNPYLGQIIYETDTGYLRVWDGSAWDYLSQSLDSWTTPRGVVATTSGGTSGRGYKAITTATVNTQTAGLVDITDASMTFTGIAGRLYSASLFGFAASTSSVGVCAFYVTDASNTQLQYQYEEFSANGYGQLSMRYIFTQTGSGTIKFRMDSLVAQTTVFGAVPAVGMMAIEDIGPS